MPQYIQYYAASHMITSAVLLLLGKVTSEVDLITSADYRHFHIGTFVRIEQTCQVSCIVRETPTSTCLLRKKLAVSP